MLKRHDFDLANASLFQRIRFSQVLARLGFGDLHICRAIVNRRLTLALEESQYQELYKTIS